MAMPKSQSRRVRGALLLAMCFCSLWSFSSRAFTKTEEVPEESGGAVKFVGEHPLIFTFLSMALCGALCYTESSSTAKLEFSNRDYFTFQLIQNILCFASGLINALCIFDMGMTVSHQSGNTSHAGRLIMDGGAKFGHLLAAFCFGSFFAGYSKSDTELIYSGRYSPNLLASALAVVAGCLVHYCKEHSGEGNDNTSECLLLFAFSQGIMNGITRRCQTLPICTTHFTGYLTDVGTLLGWCARDGVMGEKFQKAMLFAAGILFFGLGGVAAKELHESYSMQAALISAALVAAVAGLRPPGTATAPAAPSPVASGDVSPPAVPGTAPEERPLRPADPARLSALLEGTQDSLTYSTLESSLPTLQRCFEESDKDPKADQTASEVPPSSTAVKAEVISLHLAAGAESSAGYPTAPEPDATAEIERLRCRRFCAIM